MQNKLTSGPVLFWQFFREELIILDESIVSTRDVCLSCRCHGTASLVLRSVVAEKGWGTHQEVFAIFLLPFPDQVRSIPIFIMASETTRTGSPNTTGLSEKPDTNNGHHHLEKSDTPTTLNKDVESHAHAHHHEKVGILNRHIPNNPLTMDKITFKRFMAIIAMTFLWTGSQIPAYLYGGVPPYSMYSMKSRKFALTVSSLWRYWRR